MKYNGLNHVAFATGDMDKTVRFWRDLLGMRLVASHGGLGHRQYFFQIADNQFVAFFEWPFTQRVPNKRHGEPVKGPFIYDHISFGMDSEDEQWELAAKLIEAGFSCSDMIDHGFIRSIYTFDPNGIPLEFSSFVPGVDLVNHPVLADSEKPQSATEGPEPHEDFWPPVTDPFKEDEKIIQPGEGLDVFRPE